MDELVHDFMCEAAEGLTGLQGGVARLAVDPTDAASAADMLRRLHGLKGVYSFMGFARSEALAHAGESLLAAMTERAAAPAALSLLTRMIERLGGLYADTSALRAEPEGDDRDLIAALEGAAVELHGREALPAPQTALPPAVPTIIFAHNGLDRRAPAPWCGLDTFARALGDRLGKRVDLTVGGDDVRIASAAAAPLRTALIAMVRNACDHGVENPMERRIRGKPTLSVLHLSVHRTDEGVAIELADDGRGVDPAQIRSRCVASGHMDVSVAARLTDEEAQRQIFATGITTAPAVTALSGRGLGLELVRRELDSLGGSVSLASVPGRGARFVMALPASALAAPAARGRVAA
jgi:two-component system chemotaxis sensor kinase CheA